MKVRSSIYKLLRRARVTAELAYAAPFAEQVHWHRRAASFAKRWPPASQLSKETNGANRLREFAESRREGPGIWKWNHYFDIYQRHFERFRGTDVHVLEIGIYSGGSLDMWRDYFGPNCTIYGIDIEESCRVYEGKQVKVFIGDQADRDFWRRFRSEVERVDIVIDDGGHNVYQQAVTLEEIVPHMQPGGVFLCEDIHGEFNRFGGYVAGLLQELNAATLHIDRDNPRRRLSSPAVDFQTCIESIHSYPYVTVIEKRRAPLTEFVAPKFGTEWQPFL